LPRGTVNYARSDLCGRGSELQRSSPPAGELANDVSKGCAGTLQLGKLIVELDSTPAERCNFRLRQSQSAPHGIPNPCKVGSAGLRYVANLSSAERENFKQNGLARAREFTWDRAIQKTMQVISRLI